MELHKEILQKQLEILLNGFEDSKVDERYYYQNLYLNELVEHAGDSSWEIERIVAREAVKYPELHELMRNLVKRITAYNNSGGICIHGFYYPLHVNDEDHAGAGYARELAVANKKDIQTYIDFYLTNDVDHEVRQKSDIEAILGKWGICEATYPLLVARWFEAGQHGDEQVEEHLDEITEKFKDPAERDLFITACAHWFISSINNKHIINGDDKEALNRFFSALFDQVQHFEEYYAEHHSDEDFEEEHMFGPVVKKFFTFVTAGKTPAFADLI